MVSKYYKKTIYPQYGMTVKEMAEGVKGYWGRRIIVRRSGVNIPHPYSVTEGFDADLPDQMIKSSKLHYGGGIITKEENIPEGKICEGADVYYQIIEMALKDMKMTQKEIEDKLIYGFRILPDERWARKHIRKKIDEMYRFGYLGTIEEKIGKIIKIVKYFSSIPVITSDVPHDFIEGFEPIAYHILEYIEDIGQDGVKISSLEEEFIYKRRWIKNRKILDEYLTYLLMHKCIVIEENKVKFKKPLPMNIVKGE